ncbi:hypothetical protein [Burkholderia ubonensis]|uniref:hypothetical protein n=1 Tax=Burkholderia ubonensis TaxID=101571 RepID=UPI000BA5B62F|nr:hypothetical protein [Burkholderia ubonensis]PAJ88273.1 hypothetical protein CJO70_07305 [Burkholderia ubonensis]PAJ94851.1 hypothetical protein CJO69_09840 [Burkholderia ubonensis]PAK08659.1 hypothetical protein CJO67_06610 [Burkholderia ubonensis]RQP71207.1 hypothetical protein DF013_22670 [Burkholderia ubonensis]RQP82857.1 hypothetical protein DF014_18800 [Burkholderia ubonensis]
MRECDEVAAAMLANYRAWLAQTGKLRTMDAAREFVKLDPILADESATVRDNIAHCLYRLSGRME